jgi:hypothetical protein
MAKIMAGPENAGLNSILVIKAHLVLNWLIRLRPKFTNFQLLTSSAVLQKIEHVINLITCSKISKRPAGPKKDRQDRLTSLEQIKGFTNQDIAFLYNLQDRFEIRF